MIAYLKNLNQDAFVVYILLPLSLIFLSFLSISYGAISISFYDIYQGFSGGEFYFIIHEYRLPRLIIGMLAGAFLGGSGIIAQTILRNGLASPDVLSITRGAGLISVLMISIFHNIDFKYMVILSIFGGLASGFVLLLFYQMNFSIKAIVIIGVALNILYANIIDYVIITRPFKMYEALLWLTGSTWGRGWDHVNILIPFIILIIPLFLINRQLSIIYIGNDKAKTLGINIDHITILGLLIAIIWCSVSVAVCGPIGFIGLMSPHIIKAMVKNNGLHVIIGSMLIGSIMVVMSDLLGRVINPPVEISCGIITSFIGSLFFLYIVLSKK